MATPARCPTPREECADDAIPTSSRQDVTINAFTSAAAEGGDLFGIAGRSIIAIPADELKTQLSRARTEDVAGALGKRVGAMVTIPVPGPLPGPRIGAAERLEWAAQSSVGMRTGNEDAYQADAEAGFFVVGDGLGGHEFGEEASQTAVATAAEVYAAEAARVDGSETAGRAFELAGSRVARKTGSGGSTLDVVRIRRGRAEIAHVGDSRVYLFRGSHLGQLTDDDSVVGDLIRRGLLTPEEARKDSRRNILTRAVDRNCWPPFYDVLDLSDHDILLLCSDGLTGPVPDDRIEAILESARGDIARAASELVAAAYESGAPDNVTVLLVRFREGRVARRVSRQRQLRRNTDRPAASPGRKLAR
ncbi:MAG: protein phosphatase 2C domain-containing protein [Acidobacteriota bacterium]